jgi:hypothetical protein
MAVHNGLHTGPIELTPVVSAVLTVAKSVYADGTVLYTVGQPGNVFAHTASAEEALGAIMSVLRMDI